MEGFTAVASMARKKLELSGGRSNLPEDQRELDLAVVKLLRAFPLAERGWDCCCLNNLNAREPYSVS